MAFDEADAAIYFGRDDDIRRLIEHLNARRAQGGADWERTLYREVREIIEGPAKVAGILVDDALVVAAIADARTEDAMPLLAFALRELYDHAASSGRLTVEAYRSLGDPQSQLSPLENAVRRKAEELLSAARPGPEDLQALKEAFIPAMVRVNAEGEYVRRPATLNALPLRALPLIERLAKARLLTILEEHGVTAVEVAHEALLRKWPLLRGWLDEEREFLIGKDQLEQDLLDWERAAQEQKTEALLSGLKLTRARVWLAAKPLQLTRSERNFIQLSNSRQKKDHATRLASWATVGFLVLVSLVGYIVVQRRTLAKDNNLRASNLSNCRILLPKNAELISISPLPAGFGKTPWGSGEPMKLNDLRTGSESFGLSPGYYVLQYKLGGRSYSYGIFSRGYGFDPTIEVPTPPDNIPGYQFIPGGTVPSGDLLGIGSDTEGSAAPVILKPYFISLDIVSEAADRTGAEFSQTAYGFTWQEAFKYAQRSGARLPTLVEWEWAATLGIISWQDQPKWEWTSTRPLVGSYDDEDGRNNPWSLDPGRIIVGGGLSDRAADAGEEDTEADVQDFLTHYPSIAKDFAQGGLRDGLQYEDDPRYLQDHPELVRFLNLHPDEHDMVYQPDEPSKFLVAHPTSNRVEPIGHVHVFRLARNIERQTLKRLPSFTVGFAPDTNQPDIESMKALRRFAESWIENPPTGREILLGGNTDQLGSSEYDLALGENLASSVNPHFLFDSSL